MNSEWQMVNYELPSYFWPAPTADCLLLTLEAGGRQGDSQFRAQDCQLTTDPPRRDN